MYPSTAVSTGTASAVAFVNVLSALNSFTRTPRLNPIPSMFVRTSAALNVILPVPWSTVKNLPTRKKPSWSVLAKKQRPLLRSCTCALLAKPSLSKLSSSVTAAIFGPPKILSG